MRGVTLIEAVITIVVIVVLISGFGTALYSTVVNARDRSASNQLEAIKKGLVGEPRIVPPGEKSGMRHGYLGDMGSLPPSLSSLETAGTQPDYTVNSLLQLGAGWRGPYVSSIVAGGFTDPWGNGLVYTTSIGTSGVTGATVMATIRSIGPDGQNGTSDDQVVEIYKSESFAKLLGYVKDVLGATVGGIDVEISYPVNGVIVNPPTKIATNNDGLYSFENIPHGPQVIQLKPKLSYVRGTGFTTGASRNNVEFVVENLSKDALTVSAIRLTWTTVPASDFKRLIVTGPAGEFSGQAFNGTAPSATTIAFTNIQTDGTGVNQEPFRVDVSGLVMTVPDAIIGTVGTGETIKFQMEDFEEAGNNTDVDMTGVTFTVELTLVPAATSTTVFAPVRK